MSALQKYLDISFHDAKWSDMTLLEQGNLHTEASKELSALRAALEDAREALQPFANEAEMWGSKSKDETTPFIKGDDGNGDFAAFTVGDLRRAAAFLAKYPKA